MKKNDIVICVTNKMYGMTYDLEIGKQYQIDHFIVLPKKTLVSISDKNGPVVGAIFDDKHFMPLHVWREFQLRKVLQ